MKLVSNLAAEFEELCAYYSAHDEQGKDIVTLVRMFGDEHDHLQSEMDPDFVAAWEKFLVDHQHQMTVIMTGMVLYVLTNYWHLGQDLFESLPTLEKMLVRDTVQDISDEIARRSEANRNALLVSE